MGNPTAAILAIGDEITSGQITNTNAVWIARELEELGLRVVYHAAVPDDPPLILQSIQDATERADVTITTGGLGPTSDDLTTEVVARWASVPLALSETSWKKLEKRFRSIDLEILPIQKKVCTFPEGARIYPNEEGSADGFRVDRNGRVLLVLPGPPNEGQSVWNQGAKTEIQSRFPRTRSVVPLKWSCIGLPESQIADRVERALQGCGVRIGYRLHYPYVEVKVWPGETAARDWQARLLEAIETWVVSWDGHDVLDLWLDRVRSFPEIRVVDTLTEGRVLERISASRSSPPDTGSRLPVIHSQVGGTYTHSDTIPTFAIQRNESEPGSARIELFVSGQTRTQILSVPKLFQRVHERHRKYVTEMALKTWAEWLEGIPL